MPTGQAYYNDPFFPKISRQSARGGMEQECSLPLSIESQRCRFKAAQAPFLSCVNNMRPVGVAVGRGGRIFVSSLVMAGNEASPVSQRDRNDHARTTRPPLPFAAFRRTTAPRKSFSLNSKMHHGIAAIARISNCCVAGKRLP